MRYNFPIIYFHILVKLPAPPRFQSPPKTPAPQWTKNPLTPYHNWISPTTNSPLQTMSKWVPWYLSFSNLCIISNKPSFSTSMKGDKKMKMKKLLYDWYLHLGKKSSKFLWFCFLLSLILSFQESRKNSLIHF